MEYLNSILNQPNQRPQSVEEAIPTLCNRLQHATLSPDRRSAVLGLKSFSRQYRETVVEYGLRSLISTLKKDRESTVLVKAVLETLLILFLRAEEDDTLTRGWISQQSRVQNGKYPSPLLIENVSIDQFSLWIADEITQDQECINLLLDIIQLEEDFHIRLYTVQLFEFLLATRSAKTKDNLLNQPTSISTLVSLLKDSHDQIRNEAILLLMAVVNKNFNIQKLVAFENTFDTLFDIIDEEGGIRGSILVQDCLSLITNLLQYNASNQKYFIETQCLPKLAKLLGEPIEEQAQSPEGEEEEILPLPPIVWTEQRLQNMIITLEICKTFVTEDNGSLTSNQEKMFQSGVLYTVLKLVFSPTIDNKVRVSALETTSNLINKNPEIQLKFSQIDVPIIDPTLPSQIQTFEVLDSVPMALLNWALNINSVHAFNIRVNSAGCLHSYFRDNNESKQGFLNDQISTYSGFSLNGNGMIDEHEDEGVKQSNGSSSATTGKIMNIFTTLMDYDTEVKLNPYKCWFSAVILMYLFEEERNKDIARNVKTGNEEAGEEVMNSIQAISGLLITSLESRDPRIAIGYLMVLTVWFYEDAPAVNDFLSDQSIINSILTFVSNNSTNSSEVVVGMATVLLGVVYEFSTENSPISRKDLYSLIMKRLGRDNYSMIVKQFKEIQFFKNFDEDSTFNNTVDDTGLPDFYFDSIYVYLVKENFPRIKRSLFRDPSFQAYGKLNYEAFAELDQQYNILKSELEEEKSKDFKEREFLEQQLRSFKERSESLSGNLEKVVKELADLKENYEKVEKVLQDTEEKLTNSYKVKSEFEESSKKYSGELKEALRKVETSSETIKTLEQKLEQTEQVKKKQEDGINNITRDLFHLKKQKNEFESTIKTLEKEVKKLKDQNNKLTKDYDAKIEQLSKYNKDLSERFVRLEESLKGMTTEKEGLAKRIEESEGEITGLQETNDHLMQKLRSAASAYQSVVQEKVELEKAVKESKIQSEEKDIQISKLNEAAEELTKIKEEKNKLHDSSESIKNSLNSKVEELEKELANIEQTKLALETSKAELIKTIEEMKERQEQEKSQAQEEIRKLKSENDGLEEKLKNVTKVQSEESKKAEVVSIQLSELIEKFNKVEEEFKNTRESTTKEKRALEETISDSKVKLEESNKSLLEKIAFLEEDKKALEAKIKEKELSIVNYQSKHEELMKEAAEKGLEVKKISEELKIHELEATKAEEIQKKSSSEVNEKVSKLEELNAKFLENIKQKEQELLDFKTKTQSEIKESQELMSEKTKSVATLEKEISEQSEKSKTEITKLETKCDDLNSEYEALKAKHTKDTETFKNSKFKLESDLANSEKSLTELQKKLKEKEKELMNKNDELNFKVSALESLEKENSAKDDVISGLKTKYDNEIKEHEKYKSEISKDSIKKEEKLKSKDVQIQSLKSDLNDKLKDIEKERDMHSQNSEVVVTEYSQKLKQLEKDHSDLKEDHSVLSTKYFEETSSLTEQIQNLEDELSNSKKSYDDIMSTKLQLEEASKKMSKSLSDKDEEKSALHLKLTKDSEVLHQESLKLNEKISSLERELKTVHAKNGSLEDEVKQKTASLDSLEKDLRLLNDEVEKYKLSDDKKAKEIKQLSETKKNLTAEIEALKKSKDDIREQLDASSKEKETHDSEVLTLNSTLKEIYSQVIKISQEIININRQVKIDYTETEETSSYNGKQLKDTCAIILANIMKLKEIQTSIKDDRAKISSLAEEVESKNSSLKDLVAKLKTFEDSKSSFQDKHLELEKANKELQSSLEEASNKHENAVNDLKKELEQVTKSLESKSKEIGDFEEKIKVLEDVHEKKNVQSEETAKKITQLEDSLREKDSQISNLNGELAEQKRQNQQRAKKEEEDSKTIKDLSQKIKKLSAVPEENSSETVPKSDFDDMMLLMMDLDEKIKKYKTKLSSLGEEVTSEEEEEEEEEEDDDEDKDEDNEDE